MDEARVPDSETDWGAMDIFLFSNGQQYSPPRKYHLKSDDLNRWENTLRALARSQYGSLHSSINLYTVNGEKVQTPMELSNGNAYVAVEPPDAFIDAGYEKYLMKASKSWERRQSKNAGSDGVQIPKQGDVVLTSGHSKSGAIDAINIITPDKKIVIDTIDSIKFEGQNKSIEQQVGKKYNGVGITEKRRKILARLPPTDTRTTILRKLNSGLGSPIRKSPIRRKQNADKGNVKAITRKINGTATTVAEYNKISNPKISTSANIAKPIPTAVIQSNFRKNIKISEITYPNYNNQQKREDKDDKEVVNLYKNTEEDMASSLVEPNNISPAIPPVETPNPQSNYLHTSFETTRESVQPFIKNAQPNHAEENITNPQDILEVPSKAPDELPIRESNLNLDKDLSPSNAGMVHVYSEENDAADINKEDYFCLKLDIEERNSNNFEGTLNNKNQYKSLNDFKKENHLVTINNQNVLAQSQSKTLDSIIVTDQDSTKHAKVVVVRCPSDDNDREDINNNGTKPVEKDINTYVIIIPITTHYQKQSHDSQHEIEPKDTCEKGIQNPEISETNINSTDNEAVTLPLAEPENMQTKTDDLQEFNFPRSPSRLPEQNENAHIKHKVTVVTNDKTDNQRPEYIIVKQITPKIEESTKVEESTFEVLEIKDGQRELKIVRDASTQTEWCSVLLEARRQKDGHYTFHLPTLQMLKNNSI